MMYESLARAFDAPIDSHEHAALRDDLWFVGSSIACMYYLSRLLDENLFRLSSEEIGRKTKEFLASETSPEGGRILDDVAGFDFAVDILRYRYQERFEPEKAQADKKYLAMRALLTNPNITFEQLAIQVKTTTKQLARQSTLNYAARQLRILGIRTTA